MGLDIVVETRGGSAVIRPHGELDIATVPSLRAAVIDAIAEGRVDLVVDLAGVTFIDSSGLGALVGALKRAVRAGGRLVVTGADSRGVASAFRASGLSRLVAVEPAADAAVAVAR
jgi:anti-sigma B factor antagonist